MDKLQIENIEREIVYRLCDSALWSDDQTWAKTVKEAQQLIEGGAAVERLTDSNLHRCIAYTASWPDQAEMRDTFWWCVLALATSKLKHSPQKRFEV